MKPGYKTTEFWVTLASKGIACLAIFGVIHTSDVASVQGSIAQLVTAVATVIYAGCTGWHYVESRVEAKKEQK